MEQPTGYGSGNNDNVLRGYRDIPEEDRRKAQVFFDRGKTVADTGNYDYAIEMYIQGLNIDPENIEAHQNLREISLKRKASGGKDLGMFEKMKLGPKKGDDKQSMLNAEKLLAYEPGDASRMLALVQGAYRAGFFDTVLWAGPILQKVNAEQKKPDVSKFIALRDVYNAIEEYKLAADACHLAQTMRPDDMDLQQAMKNLAAKATMKGGRYGTAKSFRESVRDRELQDRLLEQDRDVHEVDALVRNIKEAEVAWQNDPEDPARFTKLIEALRRPEQDEYDNRAIELLDEAYTRSKQFRWRQRIGEIKMAQLARRERALKAQLDEAKDNPDFQDRAEQFKQFRIDKARTELEEFKLVLEHYPTDSNARFQVAHRTFLLGQFQEAIPLLQQVRSDPKYRTVSAILLGQAFLLAGFPDEAVDTLKAVIDEYPGRGDERSMEMFYWYGRSLEEKKDTAAALKAYSQVAQWNFNYRDVQQRIKRLRSNSPQPS